MKEQVLNKQIENVYALTPLQEGMLYHYLLNKETTEYVIQMIVSFDFPLDDGLAKNALELLTERYDALRTLIFHEKISAPQQVVLRKREVEYNIVNLENSVLGGEEYLECLSDDVKRGFDLQKDPLVRMTHIITSNKEERLVWTMHHIIVDGWSMNILFSKYADYYSALSNGISFDELHEQVQKERGAKKEYRDYIRWLGKQDKDKVNRYWNGLLQDYENDCGIVSVNKPLPTDEQMRCKRIYINREVTEALKSFTEIAGSTLSTLGEVVCGIAFQKYNRNDDVVFGKVASARNVESFDVGEIVGLFCNPIPVRVKTEKGMTISELLRNQQKQSNASSEYEYSTLADIQKETIQGSNLIKLLYVYENYKDSDKFEKKGFCSEAAREQTNYALTLAGFESRGKLGFDAMYNPNEYCDEEIDLFLERIQIICEEIARDPESLVQNIDFLTVQEREKILFDFNDTSAEYPKDKTIVELFEEQVEKTPDNIAVVFEDQNLTYSELNEKANQIAHRLREKYEVLPNDHVAILADRNIEIVVGILGILKAGGAYVPIDPNYPDDRKSFILEDCSPKALLTYKTNIETKIPVIDLSDSSVYEGEKENLERVNGPEDLIYCIYTSGTTGKPKGSEIEQRNVVRLVKNTNYAELNENTVILQTGSMSFDASTLEVWGTLLNGGRLVLTNLDVLTDSRRLKETIEKQGITTMWMTSTLFNQMMVTDGSVFDGLKHLLIGGEKLSDQHVRMFKDRKNGVKLTNGYGPTENTTFTTTYEIPDDFEMIPIGKPISNTTVYVMQGDNLCGVGVPGELCTGGDGVARGYLNRPELTAEKFVKNPFGEGTMYRTGDLVRWLPDGNIEFLGRIDEQVKIRGFRIELGEIESKIREIEAVKDCAVIARTDAQGEKAIYAYYVSGKELSATEIRDELAKTMPDYMIPSYMMRIESIPVTRNGKLDKRALPEIEVRTGSEYVAPRNETEEIICRVFNEILNVEKVSIKDSFFSLGGHSLRATRLVNRIEAETGTRITLKEVFSHPTPEQLAYLLNGEEGSVYMPIPKAEEKEYYPMSSAQKRTYLICQMDPDGILYNMPQNLKLTGEVRPEALQEALQEMLNRHEILRTQFLMVEGEPVQRILEHVEADFEYVEDTETPEDKLISEFIRPFDLDKVPLVRVRLVNRGEYYLLSIDMHHIVGDGMSMGTFTRELNALYNGETLEPLTHQFKDYSEWMRTRDLSSQSEYWKRQYEEEIPVLDMPLDYARPQEQSYAGSMIYGYTGKELGEKIKKLASETGSTEYMVLLSAAMVLLSKYSRQEDIVIGSPISGRTHKDTESMLGMFINTLAMRGRPEGKKTYLEFLSEIRETCLKAYENQEYPFEELVELVEVQRELSRNPIFDVMLVLQNNEIEEMNFSGSKTEYVETKYTVAKFDFTFNIQEQDSDFQIGFEYCTDLYKEESAKGILEHYVILLEELVENPSVKIGEISTVSEDEKNRILTDFNDTSAEYPKDKTIVELFEEQVEKTPDNIAVVFEDQNLTYSELNEKANQIAHRLREKYEVLPNDHVAILADRNVDIVVGILGILKAGGAYVPIDPNYPDDRKSFILEDCSPKALLTYKKNMETQIPVIDLSDSSVYEGKKENPERVNGPEDLIYCIYTSGTTGKPKGSEIEQRNVVRLVKNTNYADLDENTVILQTGSMSFDASTLEVWGTLLNGGRLVLTNLDVLTDSRRLKETIEKQGITTMWMTSTLFNQMIVTDGSVFDGLKHLLIGGEKLSDQHVRMFKDRKNGVKLTNGYGPTENTTFTTTYEIPDDFEMIPIGKPIANTTIYIMQGNALCGIGVPGELCTGGDGVGRGYLNRPDLTEEKFVKDPFSEGRMYRTGDLVRWMPDGNIEFLGRFDDQVKIRGFRIELGEIESRIREIENVKDCAVIVREDSNGEKAIYAYYVSEEELSNSEIREELGKTMPDYMIPSYMMRIEAIPVTRNGKLDKKALPEIEAGAGREYVAPRNTYESVLIKAFEYVLKTDRMSVLDSFFEMGGDSIRAIRAISKLRDEGYETTLRDIMTYRTVSEIAKHISVVATNVGEQGEISGKVQKTPIIRWFFDKKLPNPSFFNQSILLETKAIDIIALEKALNEISMHHDMLRARLIGQEIIIRRISEGDLFNLVENKLGDIDQNSIEEEIHLLAQKEYSSMNIYDKPWFKAVVIRGNVKDYLLIILHHLISDGVSLRIIKEDLENAYCCALSGKEINLPMKTVSFKDWADALLKFEKSQSIDNQVPYWREVQKKVKTSLIPSHTVHTGNFTTLNMHLSSDLTHKLLTESCSVYQVEINDLLLAALAMAIRKANGQNSLAVKLETHGRSVHGLELPIERTVGWFTSFYPVVLLAEEHAGDTIAQTRSILTAIPNHGESYGVLALGENPIVDSVEPNVIFNYLGVIDEARSDADSVFSYSEIDCGYAVDKENFETDKLMINGCIQKSNLEFLFSFDSGCFDVSLVSNIVASFKESLEEIIQHCENIKEGKANRKVSINDFNLDIDDQGEFDEMLNSINMLLE